MPLKFKIFLFGFPVFCILCIILTPIGAALLMSVVGWYLHTTIRLGRLAVRAYTYLVRMDDSGDEIDANFMAMRLSDSEMSFYTETMLGYVRMHYRGDQKAMIAAAREMGFFGKVELAV